MSRTVSPTAKSSGRATVQYRDTLGMSHSATVISGSGTVLNLRVRNSNAVLNLTSIAKGTSPKQTNVWF